MLHFSERICLPSYAHQNDYYYCYYFSHILRFTDEIYVEKENTRNVSYLRKRPMLYILCCLYVTVKIYYAKIYSSHCFRASKTNNNSRKNMFLLFVNVHSSLYEWNIFAVQFHIQKLFTISRSSILCKILFQVIFLQTKTEPQILNNVMNHGDVDDDNVEPSLKWNSRYQRWTVENVFTQNLISISLITS